mgnify:CR=1 FL=1
MEAKLYTLIAITALLVVMGVVILLGKGDMLISGYNTASPEERAQYNIRRLRLVMGIGIIAVAGVVLLDAFLNLRWLIIATVLPISILIVILSNTWAKN